MASTPARCAILLACTVLFAPLAAAQKTAAPKLAPKTPQSVPPAILATTPGAPSGGFLTGSDDCATPTPIAGDSVTPFDLTSATTGTQGQNEAICAAFGTTAIDFDVWWEWTPSVTGTAAVRTCNSTVTDTKLAVYPGSGCPVDGTAIACNDDSCGLQSAVSFPVTAGTAYTVQLGTFPGASGGTGEIFLTAAGPPPPPADDCANPELLPGAGTYGFDLQTATTGTQGQNEATCTSSGTSIIEDDAWYQYTATCDGMATMTTCGLTSVDTRIAVYPGVGCPADGTSIACNDDACALQSSVSWPVTTGATFTIQLGVFPGSNSNTTPGLFQLTDPCMAPDYPQMCFGDTGSCGCGNNGAADEGCLNSTGAGAVLSASGFASVNGDSLVMAAAQTPNQPGIFFQADNAINPPLSFGDGYRCCGSNVVRIGTYQPSGNSVDTATGNLIGGAGAPIATHPGNSGLMAGDTRCYQWWYRDPGAGNPCQVDYFNLSNAVSVTWAP